MKLKGFTPTPNLRKKSKPINLVWGFTIVEVLVVIAIIAILTAIAFPAINDIRKKNRDAERVADLGTLQLGLSLYSSQHATANGGYPKSLDVLVPTYVPADATVDSTGAPYTYVPLTRDSGTDQKCTYYHLGAVLELPSAQIDTADTFDSLFVSDITTTGGYKRCGTLYSGPGIRPPSISPLNYNVHP